MSVSSALSKSIPGVSPDIYSAADFAKVAELVYGAVGIVLPEGKAMLVYSRLAPLVREAGCVTFSSYIERLRTDSDEMSRAMASLTTNHTFFYREAHHFEHLRDEVRPRLVAKLDERQPVRLWSAGCSSGEETWSIMMTMLGQDRAAGVNLTRKDLRVLASDIAPHAIRKAEAGIYSENELKRMPEALRKAWTQDKDGEVSMTDAIRSIVRFRLLNLHGEWPMKGRFDVIFCRNVMIYFDNPTKERLVQRFYDALLPGGYLYIGHSERVTGPAAERLQLVGPTIYRRRVA
ncbi:chemotaxis protein methyltransferase [Novosphingobium endophyticum]|uniref:Chemotaxis protein methyltransferase n=1 Tax=Novosphingobium endophyticum TaxID=1955250 RepID=A0A916X731_9SPHN|nr:protein-glutamate O-methyltransferase CheR [Novosphingobium endophyticum]GGC10884.1 chemotaxis protein methyltransferase [Novosphingobium endophyticum]